MTEPWSGDPPTIDSVFWLAEAVSSGRDFNKEGWTSGEISQLFGQVLAFGAVDTYDKG